MTPVSREVTPRFRTEVKSAKGRARPDEPLAFRCEVQTSYCTGRATQRHHIKRRAQGGTDDASNTLDTCLTCHEWIHRHPKISYTQGWLARGVS